MKKLVITTPTIDDAPAIVELYRAVAAIEGGLARTADEISDEYVGAFVEKSLDGGVIIVARNAAGGMIVGEIHGYALGPRVFKHVIGELTIAVHPNSQGGGVGRAIFTEFMRRVAEERPDILRVELVARESNARAIEFYKSLGFKTEGRFEDRIQSVDGGFEADIPMAWRPSEAYE